MRNKLFSNQEGQSNARDILIIAAIILGVAALVIVAFIILKGQNTSAPTIDNAYLEQIKKQLPANSSGSLAPDETSTETNPSEETVVVPEEDNKIQAVLLSVEENNILITDKTTSKQTTITLTPATTITYNGQPFERARFYTGDQLEITVDKKDDAWEAKDIKVIVSASPSTPAPAPKAQNIQPDGSVKPL